MAKKLRVAIAGCCHGELHKIYSQITHRPKKQWPELLIICGDFQSLRDESDFDAISMPNKYKKLGDFQSFYTGKSKAPILTIFASGNHEASNYLHELQLGGWVAPNIYFLGYSNVIWYKGLRIAGWSGIYKDHDFYNSHYERLPLDNGARRSIYHTRFEDFVKLSLIRDKNLNMFISHDWPEGIVHNGNLNGLLKRKPFFKTDIQKGELGSPPSRELLKILKPNWWFSAHLHVKFEAQVIHDESNKRPLSTGEDNTVKKLKVNDDEINLDLGNDEEIALDFDNNNQDEIALDVDGDNGDPYPAKEMARGFSQTNFLALDKPLPRSQFLDFLEIPITNKSHPSNGKNSLYYDEEFLKIRKFFDHQFSKTQAYKTLKFEKVGSSFSEQFANDIQKTKLDSDDFIVNQDFKATKENPASQTQQLRTKFGL